MAIFQPIAPHLLSPLSPTTSQYCCPHPQHRPAPTHPTARSHTSVLSLLVCHSVTPASSVDINFTLPISIVPAAVCASWGHAVLNWTRDLAPLPFRRLFAAAELLFASIPCQFFSPSDGELYAGTSADFMGRDFAIFRTLGKHHPIRTEQHDSRWLNGEKPT